MTITTVGVLGMGTMGRPMSRHLLNAGYNVVCYDPSEEARKRAADVGARVLASPEEVARASDFVLVLVGFEQQVEAVVFGEDGIVAGARSGLLLGLGSTVSPSYARGLAERLSARDIRLLDMPLTRSDQAAEKGTLLVLGGADDVTFDACKPVLRTFATDIFNLGPFGSGQVAKMVNNMILWACMAANDEGLRLGAALGVDEEKMREALVLSSAANFPLVERSDTRPIPWAEKDLIIAQREADSLRFPLPVGSLVKEAIKEFKARHGYPTPAL